MILRKFVIAVVSKFDPKGTREADKAFGKLADGALVAARALNVFSEAEKRAGAEAATLGRKSAVAGRKVALSGKKAKRAAIDWKAFGGSLKALGPAAAGVGRAIGGLALGVVGVGAAVIQQGASFETLRAQLGNLLGGADEAERAFKGLKAFAKETPFQVDEVTRAFIDLTSRGVKPTAERLTSLGDLTSTFGGTLEDITGAISSASRGELDPLERFVTSAKIVGDQVALSFRGQTIEVDRNAEAITDALVGFGKMEGVSGAMAVQMGTTTGIISNLKIAAAEFLDEVAQAGVLEEFKGLLEDVGGLAGGQGLAGILANFLVSGLKAVREWISNITSEDIEGFFKAVISAAETLGSVVAGLAKVLELFSDASGDTASTVANLTLAVLALVTAFSGPAGLAIAAGAVGAIMGRMLGNLIADLDGTNDAIDALDARISGLRTSIAAHKASIAESEKGFAAAQERNVASSVKHQKARDARLAKLSGGLGGGLIRDIGNEDAGFQAQFIALGDEGERSAASDKLFTRQGQTVLAAVKDAEAKKIAGVERRARDESRRRGESQTEVAAASKRAREAATKAADTQRKKAFEIATKTFAETGSGEAAALAAARSVEGRGKKGKAKKGKSGSQFFDFEKQAASAARSQGEAFAETELQRFVAEGTAFEQAVQLSRSAGKQRAAELEKRFRDAGEIFDVEDNILDVLGLKGPDSMMRKRPAPETLIINMAPTFNMIAGDFNLQLSGANAGTLAEATGAGAQTAVEQGLMPSMDAIKSMVNKMFRLEADRLISSAGGGRNSSAPPG